MAMEITEILLSAQSPFGHVLSAAEETLEQLQKQNLPQFFLSLAVELSNDQKPPESRRLAGIILKNSLDAKDSNRKKELAHRWVSVDLSIKAQIKDSLLQTLGSSVMEARHTSSQVIAKIAYIEIPRQEWQDLIERLLNNMKQQAAPVALKQATLEALGYVCEEVYQNLEQEQVNAVLTAVVQGMTQQEHSCEVRLAAVRCLYNALDFARSNFMNEMERNYIMQVVCEAAISKELEIRQAAFECIVSIASRYYDILQPYMDTLLTLTENAVKGDEEPVALQAIEFWSAICDEEIERQETNDVEGNSEVPHSHFIQKALPLLGPMLLETLLKQEEDQDLDDATWSLSIAGGTCLGLVARTVGDAIVSLVLPFVQDNITKPEWRNREAATLAFGSILEGACVEKLSPFVVHSGLDYLLNAIEDENSLVKDTAAWTLRRIFEILHSPSSDYPVITAEKLPHVITVLKRSISDAPNVSEKVCGAIYFLAQGYEDAESDSSLLTPYLCDIIPALLATAVRMDTNSVILRAAAYETLKEIVRCSRVPETSDIMDNLLVEIMNRLSETVELWIMLSEDREKQSNLQNLLFGVLKVIVQKLSGHDAMKSKILQYADRMMLVFHQVFWCGSATVYEEAMLAIVSFVYATGPEFAKHMDKLSFYLWSGLQSCEYEVYSVAVSVIGDICHALEIHILPHCRFIIIHLLHDLFRPELDRSLKPRIFSCFGDIALAIGEHFKTYVEAVQRTATKQFVTLDSSDEDMLEYKNQLWRGIFEAYSGILQGCKSSKAQLMLSYVTHILWFTKAVFRHKAYSKHFEKYNKYVLEMLQGAAEHCEKLDSSYEHMVEHGNRLRGCIFEAYSNILQRFESLNVQLMFSDATKLLQFIAAVFKDKNTDKRVTRAAVAVISNLAGTLAPHMAPVLQRCRHHLNLLEEDLKSDDDQLKTTAISTRVLIGNNMLDVMKIRFGRRLQSPFVSESDSDMSGSSSDDEIEGPLSATTEDSDEDGHGSDYD